MSNRFTRELGHDMYKGITLSHSYMAYTACTLWRSQCSPKYSRWTPHSLSTKSHLVTLGTTLLLLMLWGFATFSLRDIMLGVYVSGILWSFPLLSAITTLWLSVRWSQTTPGLRYPRVSMLRYISARTCIFIKPYSISFWCNVIRCVVWYILSISSLFC